MMSLLLFAFLFSPSPSWAWGKKGHEIVASIAARLLVEKRKMIYLRDHEFDLGYYANVPDIIWKNLGDEKRYEEEPTHFLDWGPAMEKIFGNPENIPLKFSDYKNKMGSQFNAKDGMLLWRIQSLYDHCMGIQKQGELLVCAGVLSHYLGDLSQPLHATANYDGQMTGQKGIHSFFENDMINVLDPEIRLDVLATALSLYNLKSAVPESLPIRIRKVFTESYNNVPALLKIDKEGTRDVNKAGAEKFRKLLVDRLAAGAVLTAFTWDPLFSHLEHFETKKFYFFDGNPQYIKPSFLQRDVK